MMRSQLISSEWRLASHVRVRLLSFFLLSMFLLGIASTARADVRDWERGIAVTSESPDQLLSPSSDAVISRASQIGASYISLSPTWYQNDESSIFVQPRPETTASDAALAHAIQVAHQVGLKVMLIPFLDLYDGKWSGFIVPRDQDLWWGSYREFVLHYARLAAANNVEQYSVGRELVRQSNNPANANRWHDLLTQVRKIYSGKITYQANWGTDWAEEFNKVTFWGDQNIDIIGVNGYFPIVGADDYKNGCPNLDTLIRGWQMPIRALTQLQARYHKPLLISEIGYRSIDGAAIDPFAHWRDGSYNPEEQALAYKAFFEAWRNVPWMAGVFWWEWKSDPSTVASYDRYYSSQNKSAEKVLEEYYSPYRTAAQINLPQSSPIPIKPVTKPQINNAVSARPVNNPSVVTQAVNSTSSDTPRTTRSDSDQLQILWPQDQAVVSGFEKIKATCKGMQLSQYDLTWRVDGGRENYFTDSTDGDAHKEARVNFSTWNWQPSGHYRLTITAKDQQGRQIAEREIEIVVKQ